ncbi:MAG: T9SS type A sorting domain-containing protein [Ignavibacteria bacterium]
MKILKFSVLIIIFLNSVLITAVMCQEDEENESSESILEREEYINERRAGGPGKTVPPSAYEKAFIEKQRLPEDRNLPNSPTAITSWQTVTPSGMFYQVTNDNYVSGRTNGIAFHPTNPNTIYIAAAQGGVWKTTDAGLHWTVLTDNLGSIASGDIAIDPSDPNVLYYGTGELNYSLDSQYGDGIYKTTNAGLNWTKVATTLQVGTYTGKIIVDPTNSNNVYCAGNLGIFKSTNAGLNWTNVNAINSSSLVMDATNPSILYCSSGSGASFIYKTTNAGLNWTLLTDGLTTTNGRRTQLAISPDNPNYIYASVAASSGALLGLFRTTNGGANWTLQNSATNYMSSQGWYDNAVTVIPGNPDGVIVGGLDAYVSTNGGVTLTKKSTWSTNNPSNFSHADIHYLTYNGSVLYCCSDGGVYKSLDNADTWSDLNKNISTLQFQSADYDPTDPYKIYGGCQDNNKQTTTDNGVVWIQRTTGDGGYTIVDPVDVNYVYGQYVNGSIQRSGNSGVSFTNITPSGSSGGLFYNPYEMAPGDHNTVVFARANVWKTTSIQTSSTSSGWTQIATSAVLGGNASAIGISFTDIDKIYVGTSSGKILVTTNNGTNWTTTTGLPYITDLWVDFSDDDICYATTGGNIPDKHVFKTTNGGLNWASISTDLPNISVNSIAIRQTSPKMIFAGTDLGVFQSTNDGANWISFNTGFPNVEVYDLKYKEGPKLLLAATHGRGCFMFDISQIVTVQNHNGIPEKFSLSQNFPNPFNPTTKINYEIPLSGNGPIAVSLKIYNALGNEVAVLVGTQQNAGSYEVNFNAEKLSSGVYFYKLIAGDNIASKSMVILK